MASYKLNNGTDRFLSGTVCFKYAFNRRKYIYIISVFIGNSAEIQNQAGQVFIRLANMAIIPIYNTRQRIAVIKIYIFTVKIPMDINLSIKNFF